MAGNNLKTIVTADTSGFKKGMKESKAALNDFQKQGESAFRASARLLVTPPELSAPLPGT